MTRVALLLFGVVVASPALSVPERRNEPSLLPASNPSVRTAQGFSPATFSTSPVRADATPTENFPDTIEGQARQTLQNVKAIVEAAGLTMEHVVYSQVYLNDMAHHDAMDRVWKEFFPKAPPARAVLGVYRLPTDIAVEINAVAFRDLARKRPIVPAGYPQNLSWSPGMMAGNRLYLSGFTGRRRGDGQDAARPGRAGATGARQHETDAGRGRHGLPPRRVRQPVPDGQGIATDERHLREALRVRQHAGARDDSRRRACRAGTPSSSPAWPSPICRKRRRRQAEEHEPERDGQPLRVCRRHVLLFGQGAVHARDRGNLQGIWVGTVEAQVRQTMRNLLDGLEEAGLALSNVVATNVYLDDMNDFARMNRIYAQYFPDAPPARTTVAQLAPADRTPRNEDTYPGLEQISLIAVK